MAVPGGPLVELYELVLQTPSLLGRLIYVANLWNPQTGRYHRSLPDRLQTAEADKALAEWHRRFFTEWLALSLEEKVTDVALYRTSIGDGHDDIKTIRERCEAAIPPLVRSEERKFFNQDLTVILAILVGKKGWAGG